MCTALFHSIGPSLVGSYIRERIVAPKRRVRIIEAAADRMFAFEVANTVAGTVCGAQQTGKGNIAFIIARKDHSMNYNRWL